MKSRLFSRNALVVMNKLKVITLTEGVGLQGEGAVWGKVFWAGNIMAASYVFHHGDYVDDNSY